MIYPLAVVLIVLGLVNRYVNHSIYLSAMIFTGVFSLIETINHTFLKDAFDGLLGYFPLYQEGVGWIFPAILGVIVGAIVHKLKVPMVAK